MNTYINCAISFKIRTTVLLLLTASSLAMSQQHAFGSVVRGTIRENDDQVKNEYNGEYDVGEALSPETMTKAHGMLGSTEPRLSSSSLPVLHDALVRWFGKNERSNGTNGIRNIGKKMATGQPRATEVDVQDGYAEYGLEGEGTGQAVAKEGNRRTRRSAFDFWYYDFPFDVDCDYPPCPTWSDWHGIGACNATCGGGTRLLVRYCENADDEHQGDCEGEKTRMEECNTQKCPAWTSWKKSGQCSVTCGAGIVNFTRDCMLDNQPASGCMGANREYRPCNRTCPPKWTEWSQFSPCSKSCGHGGNHFRRRACMVDGKPYLGVGPNIPCKGPASEQRRCRFSKTCQSRFSLWGEWSPCRAVTCGVPGRQRRTRQCLSHDGSVLPKNKMSCKPERLYQRRPCEGKPCSSACNVLIPDIRDGENKAIYGKRARLIRPTWSQWTDWGACSITCGSGGRQTRNRMCFGVRANRDNGPFELVTDRSCRGSPIESRHCEYDINCPHWDQWGEWNQCTTTCGYDGKRERTRKCVVEMFEKIAVSDGRDASRFIAGELEPAIGSMDAFTVGQQETKLTNHSLPHRMVYTQNTSIRNDERYLERTVILQPTYCHGGASGAKMARLCSERACPPPWGEWQQWSECDVTCGKGQMRRTRKCLQENCHGEHHELAVCYQPPCWGEWTPYSPCTTSCGSGYQIRYRGCRGITEHLPEYNKCQGESVQNVTCNSQACPRWGQWSQWGQCSASCGGGGIRTRSRECETALCAGQNIEIESCNYQPCPYWNEWSSFTCCSVSCGEGVKTRKRICRHGKAGELGCSGAGVDQQPCDAGRCKTMPPPELDPTKCGKKPNKATKRTFLKILNGNTSDEHEWPWQVSWQHFTCIGGIYDCKWEHLCGATLLSSKWVITAGHCIEEWDYRVIYDDPGDKWSVVVQMTKLYENGDRYYLKRVVLHPRYEYSDHSGVPIHDLALLQLKKSVPINDHAMPACLPEATRPESNKNCYITGWGNLAPRSALSKPLRHAKLPVLQFDVCQKLGYYYQTYLKKDLHLCVGDAHSHDAADSCKGDSGGPMMCSRDDGKWYLAGVTSFGFEDCGTKGHVGVYVPMTEFEDWVKETIKMYSRNGC